MGRRWNEVKGFSLIEVLVATSVLTVGIASLAQLALLSRASAQAAWTTTIATMLAQNKIEYVRASEWPADAAAECCEFFDADGQALGAGSSPPAGTVFTQRWSVESQPGFPAEARVIQVLVEPIRGNGAVRLVLVRSLRGR